MNMNFKRKLPIPMEIKEQYPITYKLEQMKEKRDKEIKDIFAQQRELGNSIILHPILHK